ncbi:MAG: 2-dehydropantoate 2-reductase [Lachnospiraceae bacterium]|nr:2-dehydropantoate 2-reductase [Lachnospiraceae bacterium]
MNILIIGAGALGIGVGASLVDSGCQVDFIARGETKDAIKSNGIARKGMFKDIIVPAGKVGVYDDYASLPENCYDYVLITTKTTANEEVSECLLDYSECMKDNCNIVFMQNGMGYEASFAEKFPQEMLYHSRVITGFKKELPNESTITAHQAPILLGSIYGYDEEEIKDLADAINNSGMPAQLEEELSKALWAKFIYNTTLNPLGAILGKSYGELADSDYAHPIMDILIEETFEILNASGSVTYWSSADEYRKVLFEELIPVTYEHRSSTLQDIEKKQRTEIDTLTGSLLNLASRCNVSAPVHSMVYWLIKAMEENF